MVDLVAGLPWVRCCCVVDLVAGRCAAATLAFFASSSLFLRFASSTLAALSLFCTSFLAAASAAVGLFFVPSFFFTPASLKFLGADAGRFRVEIGVFFVDGRPRGVLLLYPYNCGFVLFRPPLRGPGAATAPPGGADLALTIIFLAFGAKAGRDAFLAAALFAPAFFNLTTAFAFVPAFFHTPFALAF